MSARGLIFALILVAPFWLAVAFAAAWAPR